MAKKDKTPPPAEEPKSKVDEGAEQAAAPARLSKIKLILIVVGAMVIGGGGAFAALKIFGGSAPSPAEVADSAPAAHAQPGADSENPISAPDRGERPASSADSYQPDSGEGGEYTGPRNIEFKPFIVNLNDAGGKRFLKLTMSLEAETESLETEINNKMPQFRDTLLLLLSSLSYDDISTLDGKMRLRSQMLNRINSHLSSGKIRNIYFSEFVVQ